MSCDLSDARRLTKAWNKAMENAKTRYQPIKINGKVVGRVDQTNEPAWNPTAESQLNDSRHLGNYVL